MSGTHTIWSALRTAVVGTLAFGAFALADAQAAPRFTHADLTVTVSDEDDGDEGFDRGWDRRGPRGGGYVESQWGGPPHGHAWGHRRKHWRGDHYGWGGPRHWQRCRTVWERRYHPWHGWSSYPVRRCW